MREYAQATGVGGEAATAEEGVTLAPPTFAACFTVTRSVEMFLDPDLGAHFNLVHGAQEYEFYRPVRVGDTLVCTPRIADIKAKGNMEFLTLEIECLDADSSEPVITSRGTIIFLGSGG